MRSQYRAPRGFGRVRGQNELEGEALRRPGELLRPDTGLLEAGERLGERLARHALLVLVLPPAPQAMVLLCNVGELEIEAEGTEDLRLAVKVEPADCLAELCPGGGAVALPGVAGQEPDPLLLGKQLLTLLFDEHQAEQVAEEAYVAPERSVCAHRCGESREAVRIRPRRPSPRRRGKDVLPRGGAARTRSSPGRYPSARADRQHVWSL